jgi:heme exporter protein D
VYFDSINDALAMDGHGGYVWAVAAITIAVVAWLLLQPVLSSRQLLARQRGVLQREDALKREDALRVDNAQGREDALRQEEALMDQQQEEDGDASRT